MNVFAFATILAALNAPDGTASPEPPPVTRFDVSAGIEAGGYPATDATRTLYAGAAVALDLGWWEHRVSGHLLVRSQRYTHGTGDNFYCDSSEGMLYDVSVGTRAFLVQGDWLNLFLSPTLGIAAMSIHGTASCSGQDGVRLAPILTGALGLDLRISRWSAVRLEGRASYIARDIEIGGGIQSLELGGALSFVVFRH